MSVQGHQHLGLIRMQGQRPVVGPRDDPIVWPFPMMASCPNCSWAFRQHVQPYSKCSQAGVGAPCSCSAHDMWGSGNLLAGHWVKSDSTVHFILLQAAGFARGRAHPAGAGGDLAGNLLQVEPIAGRGGGGPGGPAQAEVSAAYKRVSCHGMLGQAAQACFTQGTCTA